MKSSAGWFRLIGLLSKTDANEVYCALSASGVAVAVKIVTSARNTMECLRLNREIRLCRRSAHPHVIPILGTGTHIDSSGPRPFYAMPLYRQTLQEYLTYNPTPEQKLSVFSRILDGVQAIHSGGIIHNDLRLKNILVSDQGAEVVVADFGSARTMDLPRGGEKDALRRLRATALPVSDGKVPLCSWASRSPNADIFSLGLLLHQMFFAERSWNDYWSRAKTEAFPHSGIQHCAFEMMHHDRAKRPSAVAQVKQKIQAVGLSVGSGGINRPWAGLADAGDTQYLL